MEFALKIFETIIALGFAGGGALVFFAAKRKQGADSGKNQLIDNLEKDRDAWKSRYELEHGETQKYRDDVHKKNEESHTEIVRLVTENEQLKGRTDLTPLMNMMRTFIEEQTLINKEILSALTALLNPRKARKSAR